MSQYEYGGYDSYEAQCAEDPRGTRLWLDTEKKMDGTVPWDRLFRNPAPVYVLSCYACGRSSEYGGTPHPHHIRWCLCGAADTTTATLKDNMP